MSYILFIRMGLAHVCKTFVYSAFRINVSTAVKIDVWNYCASDAI